MLAEALKFSPSYPRARFLHSPTARTLLPPLPEPSIRPSVPITCHIPPPDLQNTYPNIYRVSPRPAPRDADRWRKHPRGPSEVRPLPPLAEHLASGPLPPLLSPPTTSHGPAGLLSDREPWQSVWSVGLTLGARLPSLPVRDQGPGKPRRARSRVSLGPGAGRDRYRESRISR